MRKNEAIEFAIWLKENCLIENDIIFYKWVDPSEILTEEDLYKLFKIEESKKKYPIFFRGKEYYEKDCNSLFVAVYESEGIEAINTDGGIYTCGGLSVYPDGTLKEF